MLGLLRAVWWAKRRVGIGAEVCLTPQLGHLHAKPWAYHREVGSHLSLADGCADHPSCRLDVNLDLTPFLGPQIRKAAQHGVCSVLKGSEFMFGEKAPAHHPAAISTAKFCIQEIEKSGGGSQAVGRVGGGWGRLGRTGPTVESWMESQLLFFCQDPRRPPPHCTC